MKFKKALNKFSYYNIINYQKYQLLDILNSKYYKKKKIILRNSYISFNFIKRNFKPHLNIERFLDIFYSKNLFPYSADSKKEDIINFLKKNEQSFIEKCLEIADKTINKEFSIFEKNYKFNNQINWHYSFFNEYNWPIINSSDITIRPRNKNVDVNYVWEFNRHQFLINLGFGYFITKNDKYVDEFKSLVLDWIKKNPPLYGINWYSGLEVSLRLISWIFSLYFFKDSKLINNRNFFKIIFSSMFQHAYYLRYFYSKRGKNHTVGELCGLYLFCKIFEKIPPIKRWEKKICKKMKKQIVLQIRPDGTNIEQSVSYHRFVLELFSLFLIIAREQINQKEINLIEKSYEYLLYIIKPNSKFPLIGDSNEITALLLRNNKDIVYRDLFSLGGIFFKRGDMRFLARKQAPLTILLFGSKISDLYNDLKIVEPVNKLRYFNNAGYIVLRNKWSERSNYLFVDFGKFGAQNAGHSHSDITNFIFSYKGKDIIIDSGTYTYNLSWEERNYFRNSVAHNILTINKKNQAIAKSWFLWEQKPKVGRRVTFDNNCILLIGYHDGYGGNIVTRQIITNKELNHITIIDKVKNIQKSSKLESLKIDIYFHFNRGLTLVSEDNKILVDNEILLRISSNLSFKTKIERTYYSPNYGVKFENQTLIVHLETSPNTDRNIEIKTEICPINQQ